LGDYIERSTINNKDLKYGVDLIVGVNSQGVFATPKGNTDGVDFSISGSGITMSLISLKLNSGL